MRGMLYEAAHVILTKPVKGGRPPDLRPGRRNAVQPDKETARSLRRKRRSTRPFSGRIGAFLPEAASLPDDGLGQVVKNAGGAWTETRRPRAFEIGPALSSSNTIRRQPRAEPVQKHAPEQGTA